MARFAVVIWAIPAGGIDVGDVVEVDDQEQTRRVNVRAVRTGDRARLFLEHLVWLPPELGPEERIVSEIVCDLRAAVASCAFSLEAHDAASEVMAKWARLT